MKNKLALLFEISLFRSLYFNFKLLPFSQAIRLPITLTRKCRFSDLSGSIKIDGPIRFSLIKFRNFNDDFICKKGSYSYIKIRGEVIFKGKADFGHGITLNVARGGKVIFGSNALIGAKVKIISEEYIEMGNNVRLSLEVQVFDTNFHYVYDMDRDTYPKRTGEVIIGEDNWIGNRTTIMKGTITNKKIIVGSNSLLNRDYRNVAPECSLIGGVPAKFIRKGLTRLFDYELEYQLNEKYNLKI